jgi:glucosamine--fructose-6-phosphate aminotransferase (isomerizing)
MPRRGDRGAARVVAAVRDRVVPLDAYQSSFGKVGTPSTVVEDLTAALTKAIEELTRPIDAIKHQAKTSPSASPRSDETLLQVAARAGSARHGRPRDSLTYRALRTLVALDPAVDGVVGWTRYGIAGDRPVHVDRSRAASRATSRRAPTTTRAARYQTPRRERARGHGGARPRRRRTLVLVPRSRATRTTGLTCCTFGSATARPRGARRVLEGYRDRYQAIADQVTEVEPTMRDDVLGTIDLIDLLTEPVARLADSWRG